MNTVSAGLLLAMLACPFVAAAQSQPSLAELARMEQERRKTVKVPGKVYTDKDVRPAPPRPAGAEAGSPAAATPVPDPVAAGEQKPDAAGDSKNEAWWRSRIVQAREDLRRSEVFAQALQSRVNALTNDFAAADPFQRGRIGEERQKALAESERVKADIERFKKLVADIEEEARQAGVPPGWLR
jgi:hypothetical protein